LAPNWQQAGEHCPHCGSRIQRTLPVAPAVTALPVQIIEESTESVSAPSETFAPPPVSRDLNDLIDMTAMVDIVFFLLIFFLVTSFVELTAAIHAPSAEPTLGKTARSTATRENVNTSTLTVRIDSDDVVWIEDQALSSRQDLIIRLRSLREETEIDSMRITASPEATHGRMVMVLDSGVGAGYRSAQLKIEEMP
jgi:biopolymer transport protein ExbD